MERVKPSLIQWTDCGSSLRAIVCFNGDIVGDVAWGLETKKWEHLQGYEGFKITANDDEDHGLNGRIELWADEPNALAAQWLELCAQ